MKPNKSSRIKVRPYLIDLIVVIAGITIAFMLDNLSQNKQEKRQEQLYLQALKEDLVSDQNSLQTLMDSSLVLARNVGEAFQLMYSQQPVEKFESRHVISTYMAPYFSGNNGTYNALINSGDMNIISSFELKTALANHYNVSYAEIRNKDSFIRNLVDQHLYPYMLKNITFNGRTSIQSYQPLLTNEAINMMGSYLNFMNLRNQGYGQLKQKCDSLIQLIDNQLK